MNNDLASKDAVDLLKKLLVVDHQYRLTSYEALKHPYFDKVRHLFPEQPIAQ